MPPVKPIDRRVEVDLRSDDAAVGLYSVLPRLFETLDTQKNAHPASFTTAAHAFTSGVR